MLQKQVYPFASVFELIKMTEQVLSQQMDRCGKGFIIQQKLNNIYIFQKLYPLMGGHQSTTNYTHNFNPELWQQASRTSHTRILTNRSNPRQVVQEHEISIADEKQLNLATELQQFRVNDPQLVSANYFNIEKSDQMCSKSYSGNLYTQQIPIRLSNIVHVPFPDVLHLYNQAFNGFHRLSKVVGPFKVNEDCIGVNNNHVAKVWHSPNFSQIQPVYRADSQQDMVRNVVSIIEANTDAYSMPQQQPSFGNFLYRENDRVGFGQAKRKLELYANHFNQGVIPRYLSCVEKAGGAQNIRSQWNQTNRHQSSQSYVQNIDQAVVSSSLVNTRPYASSHQMIVSNSPPQSGQFYQSNTFGPGTQVFGAPSVVVSPPPQFTSSRVNNQLASSEVRRTLPTTTVYTRQASLQQPAVNIFASRTVTSPVYLLPQTPKFREQVKVVSQPQNIQLRTEVNPQLTTVNRNVQVRSPQPNFTSNIAPVERRVNVVPSPTSVTVQEQPIRQTRLVQNHSEKQFNFNANKNITNTQVKVEALPVGYQNITQPIPARVVTEVGEKTIKINSTQSPNVPVSQASIQNSVSAGSQKQIVFTSQNQLPNSRQNVVTGQSTVLSQKSPSQSQLPISTNKIGLVQSKQVISSQQILNPVSNNQLPAPAPLPISQPSRNQTSVISTNPTPIQFTQQQTVQQVQQVPIQPQFLQQIQQPSSLVQTPWISQTLKFQYEQNSPSPIQSKPAQVQVQIKQKPSETQPSWINDTLNWQFKQNYQSPVTVQTPSQQQWQSPAITSARSQQVDLNQAISASSRYRQEHELSQSPDRREQNLELKTQLKSPTDASISEIQVKQSKVLEEKAFTEPKESSSINTSTRNFYNNLGNDTSGYSQNEWQYGNNDYSTSYRTNQREDNYLNNYQKKYDYDYNSYGKSTGQFARSSADDEVQELLKKVENVGESSGNKAAYSFGANADTLNYDYVSAYQTKPDPSPSRNREESVPEDYSGKYSSNNYETNNAQFANYQSNSYNSYQSNYELSANKATAKQFVPTYSFESKNQYREYKNGELTEGYRVVEKDSSNLGYQKTSENLVTGKSEGISYQPSAAITSKFAENTDLKYSMVEDDPYNVQWDPQILADLQANVHGSRKS